MKSILSIYTDTFGKGSSFREDRPERKSGLYSVIKDLIGELEDRPEKEYGLYSSFEDIS